MLLGTIQHMNVIILHSHIISKRRAFIILELLGYKNIANVILTGKIQGQTSQVPEVAMDPRKNKSFKFKGFNGLEEQEMGGGECISGRDKCHANIKFLCIPVNGITTKKGR